MKTVITTTSLLVLTLVIVAVGLTVTAPATAMDDWPPRPPTATPASPAPPPQESIKGGFIKLELIPLQASLWTQVQWRDNEGTWHDVEGWGGTLTNEHIVLWYVGPEHFGESPFRWQVYAEDEAILATSNLFSLPEEAGQTIVVTVDLEDQATSVSDGS
jgi:hypothetical protein